MRISAYTIGVLFRRIRLQLPLAGVFSRHVTTPGAGLRRSE
jgi:hypothetical protein